MRFQRCVGEAEFVRARCGFSRVLEDRVEERGRLMVASWSARTSSRRTSESDMRIWLSLGSRISINLEGVSRILEVVQATVRGKKKFPGGSLFFFSFLLYRSLKGMRQRMLQ